MKTLTTLLTITVLTLSVPAYANHGGKHDHGNMVASESTANEAVKNAACEDKVNVKVDGLVCDFCARALEKVFSKQDSVAGINVDLDNSNVTIAMKPGKTMDDETLQSLITDSGYNVRGIDKGC